MGTNKGHNASGARRGGGTLPAANGTSRTRRRRGFTLLELSAVLVVTGVVAALTLPQLRALQQNTQADQELAEFAAFMRQASDLARSSQRITCVIYTGGPGAYQFAVTPLSVTAIDAGCETRDRWDPTLLMPRTFTELNSVQFNHLIPFAPVATTSTGTGPGPTAPFQLAWAITRFGEPGGNAGWARPDWQWGFSTVPGGGFPQPPLEVTISTFAGESSVITQYNAGVFDVQD